jgi:hypothetical protein
MSAFKTLVDNYDLIMENKLEIMGYAPYRFSRVIFPSMKPHGNSQVGSNFTSIFGSYLGSYLMVWENFQRNWPDSDIIPLRAMGSPFSGYVSDFVGYSRSKQQFTRTTPEGFITGNMRRYVGRFQEMFPQKQLAVPLEQVVKEVRSNFQMHGRPSFQLLTLRDDFCRTLAIVSGIESDGPSRISYNLLQDYQYKPVVRVEAVIEIQLTHEERRMSAFNGSAVYVADLIQEGKAKLRLLGDKYGFRIYDRKQVSNSEAGLIFDLVLPDYDDVLLTETMQHVTHFMHEVDRQCHRF